ncbi:MAG: flagellar basal body FlgE domain-containing protein [Myxococcota bacterium]|nr:flagellar basal body FlgE domain-containing protein [Myxococcota bacterium]
MSGLLVGLSACSDKEEVEDTGSEQEETDTSADADITVEYDDLDEDGYTEEEGDCDDGDASVFPGAVDSDVDGVDQDCDQVDGPDLDGDGVADSQFGGEDCDDTDDTVQSRPNDADCDGYEAPEDCDDTDDSIYPMAGDVAGDGVDSDCDEVDCDAGFRQGLVADSIVITGNLDAAADSTTSPLGSMIFDGMTESIAAAEDVADYSASIEILDANHATQTLHLLFEHTMEGGWNYYVLGDAAAIETSFNAIMPSGMAFVISTGMLQFESSGEIASSTQLNSSGVTPWNFKDAPPQDFTLDFGEGSALTQQSVPSSLSLTAQGTEVEWYDVSCPE